MAPGIELPSEPAPADGLIASGVGAADGSPSAARRAKVRAFLELSKKRFQTADAASFKFRNEMRRDQKFAAGAGYQWEAADREARATEGRPVLEINRIPQFIRQVSNQNRANRSQIKISPRGKGSTLKLASALQGLIRGIEVDSDADVAYDTATDGQLRNGLGFIRLIGAWTADKAMEQVCRIRRIRNPLAVYWDPSTQEADFSDTRWMHVIGVVGRDEYEARWGKLSPYHQLSEYLTGQSTDDWAPEGKVIIAEYYYVEVEDRTLLQMATGETIWETDLEDFQQAYQLERPGEGPAAVVRERTVQKRVVRWAFHNGVDILSGNKDRTAGRELPGTRIPIFPLMGDEIDLDGEIDYRGMVRDAREPQRMYNFWASSIAEAVALAPKAPWIAAKGQIEQYMNDWKESNRKAKAVLFYDPKVAGDVLVPAPQRTVVEPAIQAMVQGLTEADRDLMSVMGLFQPSLGERGSHAESGKARDVLRLQGEIANSNFLDNLQRTKRAIGRTLLEWIPVIYDTPRIEHLLQPEGKKQLAVVYAGQANQPAEGEFTDHEGHPITDLFDVGVGQYDVAVSTGPSAATEREHTEQWLLELFKVLPGLAAIGADILLENSDNEAAQQLARRAKKALPPQFQDEGDPEAQVPILQAKLAMQGQLLDKAHVAIATMAKTIETKELDRLTRKEVALIAADAQMQIALIKIGAASNDTAFQAEIARYQQTMDQIHAETMTEIEAAHADTSQAKGHEQAVSQIREQREADEAVAAATPVEPTATKKKGA